MKLRIPSYIVIGALGTLITTSCSNDEFLSKSEGSDVPQGYEQVISNNKFSLFAPTGATRGDTPCEEIIKVNDLPEYTILFSENTNKAESDYQSFSKFIKDGKVVGEVYSNVEEKEDGWIVKYKTEGDENVSFLPKQATRAKTSNMGDRVKDCITDAYNNHGWVSVWITIQSAFIRETIVAIAADGAIKNF